MPEMTNQQRAEAAAEAVDAYSEAAQFGEIIPAEILGDLLGDLRHWAARVGVDFEQCDRNARTCFEAEVREEASHAQS